MRRWIVLVALAVAACGPYPRDIGGTLERIERDGRLHVGFAELTAGDEGVARRFVGRLATASGARATIDDAPLETQLARLEDGELDLVIGKFRADTPWRAVVTVIEPIARSRSGERTLHLAPAAANGENRWIALVEREVRDARAEQAR